MVIWKYQLIITDTQYVSMPAEAKLLSVGLQKGKVCLWALVDPSKPIETKMIEIVGTGNPMPNDGLVRKFIGTVVADPFVWHVFEPFTVRSIENQTPLLEMLESLGDGKDSARDESQAIINEAVKRIHGLGFGLVADGTFKGDGIAFEALRAFRLSV